jgi:phosphoribosylformylglycinamidine synthase
MTPYEIMLSESQERMLIIVHQGREEEVKRIFEKWDLPWAEIGLVTDTGRMVVKHHGNVVADIPASKLANEAPVYQRDFASQILKPFANSRSPAFRYQRSVIGSRRCSLADHRVEELGLSPV